MSQSPLHKALAVGLALLLAGCGGQPKPTVFKSQIQATAELNPNSAGEPSPVVLRIYELADNRKFNSAEFFELYDNDAAFLGADYLGRTEIVVEPGQTIPYDRSVSPQTAWVGVVAAFRDVETAQWRQTLAVTPEKKTRFSLSLDARSVRIVKDKGWL